MRLFSFLELCTYIALLPIVYKVVIAIDITKIFKKNYVTEIKLFYFFIIIVITKILGDVVVMIMNYFRIFLGI